MILENIKVSSKGRDNLMTLKRRTGVQNWNIVCRWAFCVSLAEKSVPPPSKIPTDSQVEMSWKTFGGEYADLYEALFRLRCQADKVPLDDPKRVGEHFRIHLHRGLSYLMADKTTSNIFTLIKGFIPRETKAS